MYNDIDVKDSVDGFLVTMTVIIISVIIFVVI